MAGEVRHSREEGPESVSALLPRVPGLHDTRDRGEPRHQHRTPGVKNHHRSGIPRGHRLDELVLVPRKIERRQVLPLARERSDIHQRDPARRGVRPGESRHLGEVGVKDGRPDNWCRTGRVPHEGVGLGDIREGCGDGELVRRSRSRELLQ